MSNNDKFEGSKEKKAIICWDQFLLHFNFNHRSEESHFIREQRIITMSV